MSNNDFESILAENDLLYKLIKEKKIGPFIQLPPIADFNKDFIDWISPQYYEVFKEIFNENIGSKTEAKIVSLINQPHYCNEADMKKILLLLESHLIDSVKVSAETKLTLLNDPKDLEVLLNSTVFINKSILSYVNKAIISNFNSPKVIEQKNILIDNCLDMCKALKSTKASSEIEFSIFNSLLQRLKPMKMTKEQVLRFNTYQKKSNSAKSRYAILGIVFFIIVIFRIFARF